MNGMPPATISRTQLFYEISEPFLSNVPKEAVYCFDLVVWFQFMMFARPSPLAVHIKFQGEQNGSSGGGLFQFCQLPSGLLGVRTINWTQRINVGPQIGMNPKPILGLPDLEY